MSSRQPPAQPRLSAAVGCWLFAGRLVLGPLTSPVLLPGSHHVHPMLQVLPETLQGNHKLGETRAAPEPTLQPPTPTPPHAMLPCSAVQQSPTLVCLTRSTAVIMLNCVKSIVIIIRSSRVGISLGPMAPALVRPRHSESPAQAGDADPQRPPGTPLMGPPELLV